MERPRAARPARISEETNHATEVPKSASCRVLLVRSGEVDDGNGDCSMVKRRPLGGGVELRDVPELAGKIRKFGNRYYGIQLVTSNIAHLQPRKKLK